MYNKEKHLNSIELGSVLNLLVNEATISSAKQEALNLRPFDTIEAVQSELKKTEAAF